MDVDTSSDEGEEDYLGGDSLSDEDLDEEERLL